MSGRNCNAAAGLPPDVWVKVALKLAEDYEPEGEPDLNDVGCVLDNLLAKGFYDPVTLDTCRDLWRLAKARADRTRKGRKRRSDAAKDDYRRTLRGCAGMPLLQAMRTAAKDAWARMPKESREEYENGFFSVWKWFDLSALDVSATPGEDEACAPREAAILVRDHGLEELLAWPEVKAQVEQLEQEAKDAERHADSEGGTND